MKRNEQNETNTHTHTNTPQRKRDQHADITSEDGQYMNDRIEKTQSTKKTKHKGHTESIRARHNIM